MLPEQSPIQPREVHFAWTIIGVACVLSCLLVLCSALQVFPIPNTDARSFVPPAVWYAHHAKLYNLIEPIAFKTDVLGQGRFAYYPPLFPWLLGSLMPTPATASAFLVLGMFAIAAITSLTVLLCTMAVSLKKNLTDETAILIALMVMSYAGFNLPTGGRPELLASLFVLGAIGIFCYVPARWFALLWGVNWGLLGSTHPAGAVILLALSLIALPQRFGFKALLQVLLIASGTALAIATLLMAVSPNGLRDTLIGLSLHSQVQSLRGLHSIVSLLRHWLFRPEYFFFGPILLFALGLFMVKHKLGFASDQRLKWVYLLGIALLAFCFYYFGFRTEPIAYNFALFQPVALCVLLYLLLVNKLERPKIYRTIVLALLLISTLSPLRTTVLMGQTWRSGKTYHHARALLAAELKDPSFLFFTQGLWSLNEKYDQMWPWGAEFSAQPDPLPTSVVLLQQEARSEFFTPENAKLLLDWRQLEQPKFLGIPLSSGPQGYGFSLWQLDVQPRLD